MAVPINGAEAAKHTFPSSLSGLLLTEGKLAITPFSAALKYGELYQTVVNYRKAGFLQTKV